MHKKYFQYLKHIILSDIGIKGQDELIKKKVLCVGTGGLGSPVLTYLSLAGINKIGLVEFDKVDVTNLNRQFLFNIKNVGQKKIDCTKQYIKNINTDIKVNSYKKKLSYFNAINIIKKYDIILDCTDNSESKMIISDISVKLNIPVVHASIFGFEGYVSIFNKNIFCYRCLCKNYKNLQHVEYGVLGAVAGVIGCIQTIETIKLLIKNKFFKTLNSKIMILDFKNLNIKILKVNKDENCSIC
ncbi:MAG TPA: HesA/MoeB/ThiF family protein [Candidatus Azoamicus sp. MARI]